MKTDINGCSTCSKNSEKYEKYKDYKKRDMIQYEYRRHDGELFTCVGSTIENCRTKKDKWLIEKQKV